MQRIARHLGWILLGFLLVASPSMARCLHYSPSVVVLVGDVSTKKVPGPPGYQSLRQGDLPETIFLLRLDEPICVYGNPDSSRNTRTHRNITEVQLIIPESSLATKVGERIRITGQLTTAHSGHHRTPVVLYVETMRGS